MSRARWKYDLWHPRSWTVKLSIYLATKTKIRHTVSHVEMLCDNIAKVTDFWHLSCLQFGPGRFGRTDSHIQEMLIRALRVSVVELRRSPKCIC